MCATVSPMGGFPRTCHLPSLAPSITEATRPPVPPTRWTPQLPARSTAPSLPSPAVSANR